MAARIATALALACALAGSARPAGAQQSRNDEQARRLLDRMRLVEQELATLREELTGLRSRLRAAEEENALLRAELARRGVDVAAVLAPPASQPDEPVDAAVRSPESLADCLRTNGRRLLGGPMTDIQREQAAEQFRRWLAGTRFLFARVDWVVEVVEASELSFDPPATMHYGAGRAPINAKLAAYARPITMLELLRLRVEWLKADQAVKRTIYDERVAGLAAADPAGKRQAAAEMGRAHDAWIAASVALRKAQERYQVERKSADDRPPRKAPPPPVLLHARGRADRGVELTVFCGPEQRAALLAARPDSPVRIAGCVTDAAWPEGFATIGLRVDLAEVRPIPATQPAD